MRRLCVLGLLVVSGVTLGCASAHRAPSEGDAQAKTFASVADKARLYVVRPKSVAFPLNAIVAYADGREIARLTSGTYLIHDLEPGEHIIVADVSKSGFTSRLPDPSPAYLKVMLAAGSVTFFTASPQRPRAELKRLSDSLGQSAVGSTTLVLSTYDQGRSVRFYPPGDEDLQFGFDVKEWSLGSEKSGKNVRSVTFTRAGETSPARGELILAETFKREAFRKLSIGEFVAQLHAELAASCAMGAERRMLSEGGRTETEDTTAVYEWSLRNCASVPSQHAVSKILYGQFNIFRISFVTNADSLLPETRDSWIQQLAKTRIGR